VAKTTVLRRYDTASLCILFPTFWDNILASYSRYYYYVISNVREPFTQWGGVVSQKAGCLILSTDYSIYCTIKLHLIVQYIVFDWHNILCNPSVLPIDGQYNSLTQYCTYYPHQQKRNIYINNTLYIVVIVNIMCCAFVGLDNKL